MKKRHSAEQIIPLLRQADVALGKGEKVPEVCKQLGISEQTCSQCPPRNRYPCTQSEYPSHLNRPYAVVSCDCLRAYQVRPGLLARSNGRRHH